MNIANTAIVQYLLCNHTAWGPPPGGRRPARTQGHPRLQRERRVGPNPASFSPICMDHKHMIWGMRDRNRERRKRKRKRWRGRRHKYVCIGLYLQKIN